VTSSAAPPVFQLVTLGELKLTEVGGALLPGRRKELVLLAFLLRRGPRAVLRDELATLLWGERDEEKARQSLRQSLHQLRRVLGEVIEITPDQVRIAEGSIEFDIRAFEEDVAAGRLASAVERWNGEFLRGADDSGDEEFRSWLERERESLRRRLGSAFSALVGSEASAGRVHEVMRWSRRWVELFPLDEMGNAQLIEALSRTGDVDGARTAHAMLVTRLRRELGVDPSLEIMRLGEQLKRSSTPQERYPGSAALLTPDLIGREPVLASLLDAWSRVRTSGTVILIEGEEGIGKTRLCAELVRQARLTNQPSLVLSERATEHDRADSWSTFRRLMVGLARSAALDDAPNKALGELSAAVPALRERYVQIPHPSGQQDRLESSLRDVLRSVAANVPVLIVLDDFVRADLESQRLLLSLFSAVPPGVLVVLTRRFDDAATEAAASLSEVAHLRRMKLQPLSRDEVSALVDSMLKIVPADHAALASRLFAESGGNPFYVTSLVSVLADTGILKLGSGGVWRLEGDLASRALPLHPGLRGAVTDRLSHLHEPARRLIEALAVIESPVDVERARSAVEDSASFGEALDELLSRRLLRPAAGQPGMYEFTHDLVRRVAAERSGLHKAPSGGLLRRSRARRWVWAGVTAGLLVAAISTVVWRQGRLRAAVSGTTTRLAVMDLELLSSDSSDAYLASGLAEEINSSLARFQDVQLKSRGAVRIARQAGNTDPARLGRSLGVDYLVEGSIRHVGDRLRIAIRLIKTADGFQVWSNDFDAAMAELPALHDRVAAEVATRIGSRVSPAELAAVRRPLTRDPQAFEHFLRGNYFLARRTPPAVERAIAEYRLALARDTLFAAASARIAYSYSLLLDWGWAHGSRSADQVVSDGLALVERALAIDSLSSDAWMARAYLLESADPVQMRGAAEAFERAIAINPRNAEALHQYAQVFQVLGQWEKAYDTFRRTLTLEPDRSLPYVAMASIAWKQGKTILARQLYDSALVVDPGASYVLSARAMLRIGVGDVTGGLDDAVTAVRVEQGYSLPPHSVLAIALARTGEAARAEREVSRALSEIADPTAPSPTDTRWVASALVAIGRRSEALSLIERARPRGAWLWFYLLADDFDTIRSDPRFARVMRDARPMTDTPR
jgi:DNA-binding SARP family transcriptional activator/TolB-like protein/Tfp pilus assembly protein PilF